MTDETKIFINRDISLLFPKLKSLDFDVASVTTGACCIDTWTHAESGLIFETYLDTQKRRRRLVGTNNSWGNFTIKTQEADEPEGLIPLKKAIVACLGGKIEIKTAAGTETHRHYSENVVNIENFESALQELLQQQKEASKV